MEEEGRRHPAPLRLRAGAPPPPSRPLAWQSPDALTRDNLDALCLRGCDLGQRGSQREAERSPWREGEH